MWLKLYQKIF